jgi:hypothetical protein
MRGNRENRFEVLAFRRRGSSTALCTHSPPVRSSDCRVQRTWLEAYNCTKPRPESTKYRVSRQACLPKRFGHMDATTNQSRLRGAPC